MASGAPCSGSQPGAKAAQKPPARGVEHGDAQRQHLADLELVEGDRHVPLPPVAIGGAQCPARSPDCRARIHTASRATQRPRLIRGPPASGWRRSRPYRRTFLDPGRSRDHSTDPRRLLLARPVGRPRASPARPDREGRPCADGPCRARADQRGRRRRARRDRPGGASARRSRRAGTPTGATPAMPASRPRSPGPCPRASAPATRSGRRRCGCARRR